MIKKMKSALACFKIILAEYPFLMSLEGLSYCLNALVTGCLPWAWNKLFSAEYVVNQGFQADLWEAFSYIILFHLLLAATTLLGRVPSRVLGINEKITCVLKKNLYNKISTLQLILFEDSEVYHVINRAKDAISSDAAVNLVSRLFQTPALVISLAAMTFALWSIEPMLFVCAILSILPATVFHLAKGKRIYSLCHETTPLKRAKSYFWSLFLHPSTKREILVYGAEKYVVDKWEEASTNIYREEINFWKNSIKKKLFTDICRVLGYILGILLAAVFVYEGHRAISSFGVALTTFVSLQASYMQFLENISGFNESLLFFDDYRKILAMAPMPLLNDTIQDKAVTTIVQDVSFSYPGSSNRVLKNISLNIYKGQHIALVGTNGSGKTTLARLLYGFYLPTEGSVVRNTEEFHYTGVLQDFKRYHLNIRWNVGVSNISHISNDQMIREAMRAGMCQDSIINTALDTNIGQEFNGIEFSGGEWQSIATARSMFSDGDVYVLDEFSSALDPIREYNTYKSILRKLVGKTTVIITHRLGIAVLADRVIVMENGTIIGDGTHKR